MLRIRFPSELRSACEDQSYVLGWKDDTYNPGHPEQICHSTNLYSYPVSSATIRYLSFLKMKMSLLPRQTSINCQKQNLPSSSFFRVHFKMKHNKKSFLPLEEQNYDMADNKNRGNISSRLALRKGYDKNVESLRKSKQSFVISHSKRVRCLSIILFDKNTLPWYFFLIVHLYSSIGRYETAFLSVALYRKQ